MQRFEAWITYKPTRAVDGADDGERSCGGYVLVLKGLSADRGVKEIYKYRKKRIEAQLN